MIVLKGTTPWKWYWCRAICSFFNGINMVGCSERGWFLGIDVVDKVCRYQYELFQSFQVSMLIRLKTFKQRAQLDMNLIYSRGLSICISTFSLTRFRVDRMRLFNAWMYSSNTLQRDRFATYRDVLTSYFRLNLLLSCTNEHSHVYEHYI